MDDRMIVPFSGRRAFLRLAMPGGALLCLGGSRCLIALAQAQDKPVTPGPKHKFQSDSGMSFEEVFSTSHASSLPLWRGIEKEMGSEKFVALLKRIIDERAGRESSELAKQPGEKALAAFSQGMQTPDRFWSSVLTFRVVEDTPKAFEIKVTECLWAMTFRDAKSGDLGYVLSCYGDYASARALHAKIRLIRTKTLMQGDDCCNHRYIVEG